MTPREYISVLFNLDERVWACSSDFLRSRTYSITQEQALARAAGKSFPGGAFLSINPAIPGSSRCTTNVVECRNFLIEADIGTIKDQLNALDESELPFSTKLLSGGKSVHAIIALEEPVPVEQYREIHKRLCLFIPSADPTTCDPSRFSRFPSSFRARPDGSAAEQQILYIGSRVPNKPVMELLFGYLGNYRYAAKYPPPVIRPPRDETKLIPADDIRIALLAQSLARKFPLAHGVKNRHLSCWTTALCSNTALSDDEIAMILANHDTGDDRKVSEYEYAIQTARRRLSIVDK